MDKPSVQAFADPSCFSITARQRPRGAVSSRPYPRQSGHPSPTGRRRTRPETARRKYTPFQARPSRSRDRRRVRCGSSLQRVQPTPAGRCTGAGHQSTAITPSFTDRDGDPWQMVRPTIAATPRSRTPSETSPVRRGAQHHLPSGRFAANASLAGRPGDGPATCSTLDNSAASVWVSNWQPPRPSDRRPPAVSAIVSTVPGQAAQFHSRRRRRLHPPPAQDCQLAESGGWVRRWSP